MRCKSILVLAIVVLFVVTAWPCESAFAGSIVGWGSNYYGQATPPAGNDFVAIAAGTDHSLALKTDGSIVGWGDNYYGQATPPDGNDLVAIAAGYRHSLALKSDGSILGWGSNDRGQTTPPDSNDFVAVSVGAYYSLALKSDSSIVGWGSNYYGQATPTVGNDFVAIAAGFYHGLALKSDGSIVGWGAGAGSGWPHYGQATPPAGNDYVSIAAGGNHSLALKSDGSIIGWGDNLCGQATPPAGNDFVAISAGMRHSLALKTDGSIVGWGDNETGQATPPEGNNFVAIAAGILHNLAIVGEPTEPPVADADGPYSIYVGDTLTLDANGSTDADNDIVSFLWDLNDDETFETDAGGQVVFDVNYTYLQSLGLIVDHTYNIHLKVTDSEGKSDVNDSTLTIVPKPAIEVAVDIKPGRCPNPVNVKSSGVLPIAILGTVDFDVTTIDPTSIRLYGVEPIRSGYEDVATPISDSNDCNCITEGPDGFLDLTLKFKTQRIVEAVGDVNDGDVLELPLTGVLSDETPIVGADCILIRGRHKPINPADINKDGVVNAADFAIFSQNWLQSSIVDE